MNTSAKLIHVTVEKERCFFHVLGDKRQFYDLESLTKEHPELKEYCDLHHIELQIEMNRQKELLGFMEKL